MALYSRQAPERLVRGFGVPEFDREGRYLEAQFGDVAVVSLYLPSGSAGPHRQASKDRFLEAFLPHLRYAPAPPAALHPVRRLEHRAPADRPEELALEPEELGIPARRSAPGWTSCSTNSASSTPSASVNPEPDQYTWWSNRGQAWAKNVGWRIDYQVASPGWPAPRARRTIYASAGSPIMRR